MKRAIMLFTALLLASLIALPAADTPKPVQPNSSPATTVPSPLRPSVCARTTSTTARDRGQLYNLESDPGEPKNLLRQRPEIAAELKALRGSSHAAGRSAPGEFSPPSP